MQALLVSTQDPSASEYWTTVSFNVNAIEFNTAIPTNLSNGFQTLPFQQFSSTYSCNQLPENTIFTVLSAVSGPVTTQGQITPTPINGVPAANQTNVNTKNAGITPTPSTQNDSPSTTGYYYLFEYWNQIYCSSNLRFD